MAFYNREKELEFLRHHLSIEPNSILMIYGPKSSGKSTLLQKVVEELDLKKHAVNFIDLRRVLVYDFKGFLDVFFPKDAKEKFKDIIEGVTFNLGFFSLKAGDEALLSKNPFKVMEDKLIAARKRGIYPVIILDEIQELKHIYLNGQRHLIDELFNLFVGLTKVKHLAHIILASSDSYYINQVYESAKLEQTTEFLFIDYLDKLTVTNWLSKEQFSENEAVEGYKYLGGSPWEIIQFIEKGDRKQPLEKVCRALFIDKKVGTLKHFRNFQLKDPDLRTLFDRIIGKIVAHGFAEIEDFQNDDLEQIVPILIQKDIWFYHVDKQQIVANNQTYWWAMKQLVS